jgi:hypothetical protein
MVAAGLVLLASNPAAAVAQTQARIQAQMSSKAQAATTQAATATVVVTVNRSATGTSTLPGGFLGLSFESDSGSGGVDSGRFDDTGDLAQMLSGLGPGVLRFGGSSVDGSFRAATGPAIAGIRRLADASGWRVVYSENLGHFDAAATAADAHAVAAGLGPDLLAIACGNEPNLYSRNHRRPAGYGVRRYVAEDDECLRAVRLGAPGVPLAGPDLQPPGWLSYYAAHERGRVSTLDEHFYPLTDCGGAHADAADLLSARTAANEAGNMSAAAHAAAILGGSLRVTETNSASCSGIPGVSDTFASALWAVDFSLLAAEHHAVGMNFHSSLSWGCAAYSPLCRSAPGQYEPRPMYYGLLLLSSLGTGRLLPVHTAGAAGPAAGLTVHAVRAADGSVRVVLENLRSGAFVVRLRTGTRASQMGIVRLTAPRLTATSGISLQQSAPATCSNGQCSVSMPPYSIAVAVIPPGS